MVFNKTQMLCPIFRKSQVQGDDLHHPYRVPIRKYTVGFLHAAEGRSKAVL